MATFIPNVTDIFPEPSLFSPDFSFMDKMLQRRKAMYDQGFAQVNSAYNFVNRETTNPYNSKVKDQFLRQAKDNLKNLAMMDLSQQQNIDGATGVFAPFYKNTDVIGDQAVTEHWNRQIAIGEGFRTKDGGKQFSQTNIDYITQQKNWFAQDTPDTWKEYWSTKRSFTPYYDVSAEVREAMKNFKPSRVKTAQINGFYINVLDDKSWYEGEIAQYLNAVLSEKVKQQWRIEGAVKYGNDPAIFSQIYTKALAPDISKIDDEIMDLDIQIRREKDPAKQQELIKRRDGYVAQKDNINTNLSSIASGDLKSLRRNSEILAYDIYYKEKIGELAAGYSHKDIEQDIKFNDIAKMFWENSQKWALEEYRQNREDQREARKSAGDALKGQLPLIPVGGGPTTPTSTSYAGAKLELQQLAQTTQQVQGDLAKHINTVMGYGAGHKVTDREFSDFVKNNPSDALVMKFVDHYNAFEVASQNLGNIGKAADNFAQEKMGQIRYKAYQNLTRKKNKSGLDDQELKDWNTLHTAYNQFYGQYRDPKYTSIGTTNFGYGLNAADVRFKAAAGELSGLTGLDATLFGGIKFYPKIGGGVDVEFSVQKDPNKPAWDVGVAKANLEKAFAGTGASVEDYNTKTGTFTIRNAHSTILGTTVDPYAGLPYTTRTVLSQMANATGPGGSRQFIIPFRAKDGVNISYRVVKESGFSDGDRYYLMSNKGKILSDGSAPGADALRSTEQVGRLLYNLSQIYTGSQLNTLLSQ